MHIDEEFIGALLLSPENHWSSSDRRWNLSLSSLHRKIFLEKTNRRLSNRMIDRHRDKTDEGPFATELSSSVEHDHPWTRTFSRRKLLNFAHLAVKLQEDKWRCPSSVISRPSITICCILCKRKEKEEKNKTATSRCSEMALFSLLFLPLLLF